MPGLLDGVLQSVFGTAFAPLTLDSTLHVANRTEDAGGSITEVWADVDIPKGAIDIDATEAMRQEPGYTQLDVGIIIFLAGVPVPIDSDMEITISRREGDVRYRISNPISTDPAKATSIVRATPL